MDGLTDQQIISLFAPLSSRFDIALDADRPLLAHYTSISAVENILKSGQLWFSNPLFMNDLQEMRFGLNQGAMIFARPDLLNSAGGTKSRADLIGEAFGHFYQAFDEQYALDTYVFCASRHDRANTDGLLSMWRGYGQHGNGAALVFDTAKITPVPTSPLLAARVAYASDRDRVEQLHTLMADWAKITEQAQLPDNKLYLAAYSAFMTIKTFALTTKHIGFNEEQEWRIIYYPERDPQGLLKTHLGYHIGPRGVEPKLKYPLGYIDGVSGPDLSLDNILHSIILGPSLSSPLARKSVERMLESIQKSHLKEKVHTSGIPLRPLSGTSF